ncbi:signal peptidase II [Pseudorhodoplanes sinuspersici]|uniref:Lipoprotein signal peptidase n=1 Tax=Pseudorhodoplanes sinuspersici TaxID=1235591 RepID=A0A1W6ZWD5_9HYPH|nr:signal peptidase II [Pseudorhodoplanes sinuspersici]ARQ01075.1 signal peptidase II [Pseudorhodoplanes sinuspersici]
MMSASRARTIFLTAGAALALDQTSKSMALAALQPHVPVDVTPFFALSLGFNTGVSFGMLASDANTFRMPLIVLTLVIIVALAVMAMRATTLERVALSAIIGGAAGNLTDRIWRGRVTDFIDLFVADWHWPAFNLADTAITLGVVTLLWASLRRDTQQQAESDR